MTEQALGNALDSSREHVRVDEEGVEGLLDGAVGERPLDGAAAEVDVVLELVVRAVRDRNVRSWVEADGAPHTRVAHRHRYQRVARGGLEPPTFRFFSSRST